MLNIALCEELNGDTGLLSINDFNILCGRSAFIPVVTSMSYSGRVCILDNTEDDDDVIDKNKVGVNKENRDDDSNEVINVADNSIETVIVKNDIDYYNDHKVNENSVDN